MQDVVVDALERIGALRRPLAGGSVLELETAAIEAFVEPVDGRGKSIARDNKRSAAELSLRADAAADSGADREIFFAGINSEADHRRAHSSRVCFA
jgi:hypothetical protein